MTNADFALIRDALSNVGSAYHRRNQDVISNRVMQELGLSAGEGGLEEATIRNKLLDEKLKRELSQSTINRNNAYAEHGGYGRGHGGGSSRRGFVPEGVDIPEGYVRMPTGDIRIDRSYVNPNKAPRMTAQERFLQNDAHNIDNDIAEHEARIAILNRQAEEEKQKNMAAGKADVHFSLEEKLADEKRGLEVKQARKAALQQRMPAQQASPTPRASKPPAFGERRNGATWDGNGWVAD